MEGFSERSHFHFIDKYRTTFVFNKSSEEYRNSLIWSSERSSEIEEVLREEALSIQLEMLIYLKIWEADLFIKWMYELGRILNSEPYDWYFSLAKGQKEKKTLPSRHQTLIELIQNKIPPELEVLKRSMEEAYVINIRNAIAHSNYSFHGDVISFSFYNSINSRSETKSIKFEDWSQIFHKTLMIHNFSYWLKGQINTHYADLYSEGTPVSILITDQANKQSEHLLEFRSEYGDWKWKK